MAAQDRNTLKAWFEKQDKPLQQQFADLIDSFLLVNEEITIEQIQGLAELFHDKSDKGHLHTGNIDFSAVAFDNTGVSENAIVSEYSFSIDTNFIYIKRPDNHWVRSKIHKEATVVDLGSFPE